jgi:predicted ATPase
MGENGSGKSTLLEAIAVAFGFNPKGGGRNFNFSSKETHSNLHKHLVLIKSARRPKDGFFLRAESFYNLATEIERLDKISPFLEIYGGNSLNDQFHGESFMSLILSRFRGNGLYILDEPEAALSPSKICSLIVGIDELVKQICKTNLQFIIATHSPILSVYPHSEIFMLTDDGAIITHFKETEHFSLTKYFINNPEVMISKLLNCGDYSY